MYYVTLSEFLGDTEHIVDNTVVNEAFTTIKTTDGNAVLISEQQYVCLLESLLRKSK